MNADPDSAVLWIRIRSDPELFAIGDSDPELIPNPALDSDPK